MISSSPEGNLCFSPLPDQLAEPPMPPLPARNEIVVYQPDETIRMEVRVENETVWLSQSQMAELFGCSADNVGLHLKNVYASGELSKEATAEEFSVVRREGARMVTRRVTCYNLDAIISVGYRVNSVQGVRFRQWATGVLREYLLRGYAVNDRLDRLERKVARHDEQIGLLVRTALPPAEGIFFGGQLWDACSLVERLVGRAKTSILLIDNWVGPGTLDILAKKRTGVSVEIATSSHGKLAVSDIAKFNAQYPTLSIRISPDFHDRFLILDDKELFHIGASLKNLGKKCFAFSALDASLIPVIKSRL